MAKQQSLRKKPQQGQSQDYCLSHQHVSKEDDSEYYTNNPSKVKKVKKNQTKKSKHNNKKKQNTSRSLQEGEHAFPGQQGLSKQVKQKNTDIRQEILDLFNNIQQFNGMVFSDDMRKKLIQIHPNRNFTEQSQYDPEIEQRKIETQLNKSKIMQLLRGYSIGDMIDKVKIDDDFDKLKKAFQQPSYIFAQQITSQLYKILRVILDIVFENLHNKQIMKVKLREFGDKIVAQNDPQHDYFFFGYKFTSAENKSNKKGDLDKKFKDRYSLKPQFRQKNGYFADFVQNCGEIFLNLFETLQYKDLLPYQLLK